MLTTANLTTFIPTRDPQKSRLFYEQTLGLPFISQDPFAIVFNANGTTLRITIVKAFQPHPFTVLGWHVPNAETAVRTLTEKGITFERFPGMDQSSSGIWRSPSGAQVAWFKDPDGNLLSITQS